MPVRLLLLAVLATGFAFPAAAQSADSATVAYDRAAITPLSFAPEALHPFHADSDFHYAVAPVPPESLWDRFWFAVRRALAELFASEGFDRTWGVLKYVLIVAGVLVVVWLLMGAQKGGLFYSGRTQGLDVEVVAEDVHTMDFDALIAEARTAGQYRRAVRLHYLRVLRDLSERQFIQWREGKTNREYVRELARPDLRDPFARLTRYFEFVWYGEVDVDEAAYERAEARFEHFRRALAEEVVAA